MSDTAAASLRPDGRPEPGSSRRLWLRQIAAIVSLETSKNLFGRRALPIYLLALVPNFVMLLRLAIPMDEEIRANLGEASMFFAVFPFQLALVMTFFGCVLIFTNLFRGEIVDRSLHYYFLSPVRRELLATGKYLSGVIATSVVFGASTTLSYLLLYLPHGLERSTDYLLRGPGLGHWLAYVTATTVACLGYGAVFTTVGLFLKNPVVFAVIFFGLESINFLLPSLLKKLSVIYYVRLLSPVSLDEGPLAVIAEPASPWLSIPGLLVVCAVFLAVSAWRIRWMQIRYESD